MNPSPTPKPAPANASEAERLHAANKYIHENWIEGDRIAGADPDYAARWAYVAALRTAQSAHDEQVRALVEAWQSQADTSREESFEAQRKGQFATEGKLAVKHQVLRDCAYKLCQEFRIAFTSPEQPAATKER